MKGLMDGWTDSFTKLDQIYQTFHHNTLTLSHVHLGRSIDLLAFIEAKDSYRTVFGGGAAHLRNAGNEG